MAKIAALIAIYHLVFNRVVLKEHYLSDIMGGFLVGTLWLTIAISMMEWLTARGKINWRIV